MFFNKKDKGFSFVELLATIFIIGVVLGICFYSYIKVINRADNESTELALDNIFNASRYYVEEFFDDVVWLEDDDSNKKFSCISINELINKNLLKKDIRDKYDIADYIIVTKNEDDVIVSEEFDDVGMCSNYTHIVKIPTNEEYCNYLVYNGNSQVLTNKTEENFSFVNNIGVNAGSYEVIAKLDDGYVWEDNTVQDKTIICSINKTYPVLELSPNGEDNANVRVGTDLNTKLLSNIDGKLVIKSANPSYVVAKVMDNDFNVIANKEKDIVITPLSSRITNTIITINVIPNDTNNYYSGSVTYIIGNSSKTKIPIPTSLSYCKKNLIYNNSVLTLVEKPSQGFSFYNTTGIDVGTYEVIAKLKYGYIWEDDTLTNKVIECSINKATSVVTYQTEGGSVCNPSSKTVTYQDVYGDLCNTTRNHYLFLGWYMEDGVKVTKDTVVSLISNHNLYAHWKEYHYLVDNKIYATNLKEAISVASNNSIIKLMDDYEDTVEATIDKNITFDTNGYTWTRNVVTNIEAGSNLIVTGNGKMVKTLNSSVSTGSDSLFYNKGILTLNYDGILQYNTNVDTTISPVMYASIDNYGTVSINKANFINNKTRAISNNQNASLTITGGTITTDGGRAINNNGGNVNIKKITIETTDARAINNEGNGSVTVNEAIIKTTDARAIQNDGNGTITINSGNFDTQKINIESRVIVNASGGTICINGGSITGTNERTVQNDKTGKIIITGGTISSSNSNTIYNNANGTIEISGGTLKADGSQVIYNNANGIIKMSNGTITATGTGIYNNAGEVIISNGSITTTGARVIQNEGTGSISIKGGTFKSSLARAIQNEVNGSITIEGGFITSDGGTSLFNNGSGTISINEGVVMSINARSIQNEMNGTIYINGGTITAQEGSTVYNKGDGVIKITDGILTVKKDTSPVCVYNYGSGTIYISGGKMTATYLTTAGTGSKKAYYNKGTGTITVTGGTFDPAV